MASRNLLSIFLVLLVCYADIISCANVNERKPHIVYLGDTPPGFSTNAAEEHQNYLTMAVDSEETARESMIYSYHKSFNAFAAHLSPQEVQKLEQMDGVVGVLPNQVYKLHTTRSWDYIGFPKTVKRSTKESDVIVGLLDTGVWPESPSFNDKGFGPPPAKWKGQCVKADNFTCNNKLIGARYYNLISPRRPGFKPSPIDVEGHGTHTASTAAGASVEHAGLYNLATGTARGAVPSARVAMYKVCWADGCNDIDVLAAFDDAIHDGVDVISASVGGFQQDFFLDAMSIGSFHAMKKGIVTCLSAGNNGPGLGTVTNVAPWVITVGASSIDRQFRTKIKLNNGRRFKGISINTFRGQRRMHPVISGADAALTPGDESAQYCMINTLDPKKVKGKVVLCKDGFQPEYTVKLAGGSGIVKLQMDDRLKEVAFSSVLPMAAVDMNQMDILTNYAKTNKNLMASIHKSQEINVSVPFVPHFSSRGPNPTTSNLLKPDIVAPGLNILAAWTPLGGISGMPGDKRASNFNLISGTSMSCPHVAGAAAYVKSFHPSWSPAIIKSALMTTAKEMHATQSPNQELGYGSGQVNPIQALNPGLVYDMNEYSYMNYLCMESGYNTTIISLLQGNKKSRCEPKAKRSDLGSDHMNYPSMQYGVKTPSERFSATFVRTVKNVGRPKSVYKATMRAPKGMSVKVVPSVLEFERKWEERSFRVVVEGGPLGDKSLVHASLVWSDGRHIVRSPIVVTQMPQPF